MATQTVSLHGLKSHKLTGAHTEQEPIKYIKPDNRLSSFTKDHARPPIHENFHSFLTGSASEIQQQFSETAIATASIQNHRFDSDNNTCNQQMKETWQSKTSYEKPNTILSIEKIASSAVDIQKSVETFGSPVIAQPSKQINDRGYGARTAVNPALIVIATTEAEQTPMGLINAIHERSQQQRDNNDSQKFNESHQKSIKGATKVDAVSRNEHAQLLKREEIQVLKDVKEKFHQQLNAQYPQITVPLKHPEGIIDIHMRFDKKVIDKNSPNGSVRIMFSGSNEQIVTLFAQHREEFMKIITHEGYSVDSSRMQFKSSSPSNSLAM